MFLNPKFGVVMGRTNFLQQGWRADKCLPSTGKISSGWLIDSPKSYEVTRINTWVGYQGKSICGCVILRSRVLNRPCWNPVRWPHMASFDSSPHWTKTMYLLKTVLANRSFACMLWNRWPSRRDDLKHGFQILSHKKLRGTARIFYTLSQLW